MSTLKILVNIRKIVRSLNLESKSIQKDFGLSMTQLLSLNHLLQCEHYQSTHRHLMELLSLNSSTVTGIINRLEKKSLVARLPKSGDKRITYVVLTAKGMKLLEDAPNVLHDRLAKKLGSLSEKEQREVNSSLEIIVSAMEIKEIEASPLLIAGEPLED
ncbi:MAG: MarR family transcriptional regulator [Cyclobacteriaceae bacterium]|nr:MarR family transcriptional regulator [Cyclobacteriaceae bacterium]